MAEEGLCTPRADQVGFTPLQQHSTEATGPRKSVAVKKEYPLRKKSVGFRPPAELVVVMDTKAEGKEEEEEEEEAEAGGGAAEARVREEDGKGATEDGEADAEAAQPDQDPADDACDDEEVAVDNAVPVRPPTPPGVSHSKKLK